MTKVFWQPLRRTRLRYNFIAQYVLGDGNCLTKKFNNGTERESFIREQNAIVRQCKDSDEYVSMYKNILMLTE